MASSASAQSADLAQRRRMRKGTRSCLECRTRKIRCIFPSGSRICNGCKTHGKTCIEQTYNHVKEAGLDKRVGLKDRVKELEALVNQLMEKGSADSKVEVPERYRKKLEQRKDNGSGGMMSPSDSTCDASGVISLSSTTPSTAQLAQNAIEDIYDAVQDLDGGSLEQEDGFAKSTVQPLFDNALLSHDRAKIPSRSPQDPLTTNLARKHHARHIHYSNELHALIPKSEDLELLLQTSNSYGNSPSVFEPIWKHSLSSEMMVNYNGTMESVLKPMFESKSLIILSKALLYLALILQQLPSDSIQHKLKYPDGLTGKELIQRYIDTVEEYLVSNDGIIGSLEGLECSAIMAQLLINDGRPRKAWITFQRCINYAKLLGFHRPSSWQGDDSNPLAIGKRRERIWWMLYQGDRYLALLLGLPYSISDRHIDINYICGNVPGQYISTETFVLKLAVVAGHMIDRAQATEETGSSSFASAMQLDGELHALACMVPDSWWDISDTVDDEKTDIFELYHRGKAIFWHNECRLILHMPFMLRTLHKEQNTDMYAYNRTVALNSARMMIKCHKHLRMRQEFAAMVCQIIDFQVFTAAMLLLLDMLERPDLNEEVHEPQTIEDTELILAVTSVLRKVSRETSGRCDIAGQAVKVLDAVAHVLYGCPAPKVEHPSRVVIPYFGAVTIKSAGKKQRCKCCPPAEELEKTVLEPSATNNQDAAHAWRPIEETATEFDPSAPPGSQRRLAQPTPIPCPPDELISFQGFFDSTSGGANIGQNWAMIGQSNPQQAGPVPAEVDMAGQANASEATLWDEATWQRMLQANEMEMDGDWNWLLVE